jgi:Tol biopolymer transport system component
MPIPSRLNHYTILEPLGQGGMGDVYVAEDTRLNRKVALKVLSGLMSGDPERRTRFEREARAVAALNHPSIVTIHSVEEAEGLPFLTMELVEGKPLSAILPASGLPIDALLRIGIGISDAMAAAHQRGITHRDLKPANVMVTPDGRVKVLDFGLAKLSASAGLRRDHADAEGGGQEADFDADGVTRLPANDLTGEGRIIGTVAYMSPEQAEGKPVDQRSDIFSLGVLLHEMATGERPFKGDTNVSVMSAILRDTPSSVTDINPKLPAGLARVIRRALSKDPSRRYQTATDLRNELEELKQEIDSAATVTIAAGRPAVPRRGVSATAILLALVGLVLLSGAGLAIWWWAGPEAPAAATFTVDRFNRLTSGGNAQIAAISPDGRYVVHIKYDSGRSGLWIRQTATASDVQIVAPDEVRYDGLTFSPDGNFVYYVTYGRLGGVATLYRIPVLGGAGQKIVEDIDSRISFSPDATRFAFLRGSPSEGRNYLMTANANGTDVRQISSASSSEQFLLNAPAWSPDGQTILAGVQALKEGPHSAIAAVDVKTAGLRIVGGRWGFTHDVEWMPDGGSFVVAAIDFSGQTPQLWQVMYPGGERRRITNDLNSYSGVSVSRDGASLATVQVENTSTIWVQDAADPSKATQVTSGRNRNDGNIGLSWTTDGRIVFSSGASGRLEIWIMDGDGRNQRALTNEPTPPLFASASPDGRFIVFQSPQATGMFLKRIATDGGTVESLTKGGAEFAPIVSPDSRWVYYNSATSGSPRAFKIPLDGGEPVALGDGFFRPVGVSPDGTTLLGVGWDAKLRRGVYATLPTSGGTPTLLPLTATGIAAWSPDGHGITYPDNRNGVSNLYLATLDGKERPITRFTSDNISQFAWSPDGKRLAIARGSGSSDVVLLLRRQER